MCCRLTFCSRASPTIRWLCVSPGHSWSGGYVRLFAYPPCRCRRDSENTQRESYFSLKVNRIRILFTRLNLCGLRPVYKKIDEFHTMVCSLFRDSSRSGEIPKIFRVRAGLFVNQVNIPEGAFNTGMSCSFLDVRQWSLTQNVSGHVGAPEAS